MGGVGAGQSGTGPSRTGQDKITRKQRVEEEKIVDCVFESTQWLYKGFH